MSLISDNAMRQMKEAVSEGHCLALADLEWLFQEIDALAQEQDRLRGLCASHGIDPDGCEVCFLEDTAQLPGHVLVSTEEIAALRARVAALEAELAQKDAALREIEARVEHHHCNRCGPCIAHNALYGHMPKRQCCWPAHLAGKPT